jgi:hypothetical protein
MKNLSLNEYLKLMDKLRASMTNQQTKSKTVKILKDYALVFSFNNKLGIYVSAKYRYNYEVLEYELCKDDMFCFTQYSDKEEMKNQILCLEIVEND